MKLPRARRVLCLQPCMPLSVNTSTSDQDEIQKLNEQLMTAIISRQPPMGIGFVDGAIVPDVQTDEYETDNSNEKDNNVQYELPINGRRTTMSVELSEQS